MKTTKKVTSKAKITKKSLKTVKGGRATYVMVNGMPIITN